MNKDVLILHVPNITYKKNICAADANMHAVGLFSMCNQLNENNIGAEIVNLAIEFEVDKSFSIYDYIRNNSFKIVAFSLHWFFQMYDTIEFAKNIKLLFPEIKIVFGGYTASCFINELFSRFDFIDYIIKGEGELPLLLLCQYILNRKLIDKNKIPNLSYKVLNKIIVNNSKWHASSKELDNFNFTNLNQMKNYECYSNFIYVLVLGRGCSGNCSCCGGGKKIQKSKYNRSEISKRNPIVISKEILKLYQKYNFKKFNITFDTIRGKDDLIIKIIKHLEEKFLKKIIFDIECFALPNYKLIDVVSKRLSKSSFIVISPDFASEKVRKLHKSFYYSNKALYKILSYMDDKKVNSLIYFSNLFDDNIDERNARIEMFDYIKNNFKCAKVVVGFVTLDPYSPITLNPQKYKYVTKGLKFNFDYYYNFWKNN